MGKFGFSKTPKVSSGGNETHKFVNGPAFKIDNPVQKLIHVLGTFFNEPTYYASTKSGKTSKNSPTGLTEQAQSVIDAAHAVAEASPEDLLVIAAWARDKYNGLKLRTTPQVLFAIAAAHNSTKPFLERYATKVMTRSDDIRSTFAAYNKLFVHPGAKRTLPSAFKKSLALAYSKQDPYKLIKYNTAEHPTHRDVLAMIRGKKMAKFVEDAKDGYPLSKGLYEYLCFGKVTEAAPRIVLNRTKFFQKKDLSKVTAKEVEEAGLTWENIKTHFRTNTADMWHLCIPIMDEMALMRNLRNFEQANLSSEDWNSVEERLLPFEEINGLMQPKKTVQLPFRFLAAYDNVTTGRAKSIIAKGFDRSVATVPELPGKSVIFVDNSGSMEQPVSDKSKLMMKDAGNSLGAILCKKNTNNVDVYVFGTSLKKVELNSVDSGITLLEHIRRVGNTTGGGTNIDAVERQMNEYTKNKVSVERFIILSDMCAYSYGGGVRGGFQRAFDNYRKTVNKNCYLYSCNLAGYSQPQVNPDSNNVIIMGGWSENIFQIMLSAENQTRETTAKKVNTIIPTLDELRLRYKVE